ncbi:hypothetical protein [Phreatobacter sp.]|uniref:hypothetical protein n=1 Tax=Phreatobacter sp. TaxID=1966341 RepID=UPI003F72F62E
MISRTMKMAAAGLVVATGLVATMAPAEAQRYRRGNPGAAIGAGIALGILGIGAAAIAADQRRQAYERGYGYYGGPGYAYGPAPYAYEEAPAYYAPPTVYCRPNRSADDRYPHTFDRCRRY